MKRRFSKIISFFVPVLMAACSLFVANSVKSGTDLASADTATSYPRGGSSGTLLFVNGGGTYFNDVDVAIYCFNGTQSAWSNKSSHRIYNDYISVMLPYYNGNSTTWSKMIICRYDRNKDPSVDGFDGVYNQTNDISLGELLYAQNTFNITGYKEEKMTYVVDSHNTYGVGSEKHIYLDLSEFTDWESNNAKFAIYFCNPSSTLETRWGQCFSGDKVYHSSFCWKVNGQDNEHLYECIVPKINSSTIWSTVVAVRIDPVAGEPNWDNKWNQTSDLNFVDSNKDSNVIKITGWNDGEITSNTISNADRANFFGKYFLDTVQCSGNGNSDATTSQMWDLVAYEYDVHLSQTIQGLIWTASCDEEGSDIEKAMARYDYIVLYKQYAHNDFINRQESPNKGYANYWRTSILNNESANITFVICLIVSSLTLVSFVSIKALKKKLLK